MQLVEIQIIVTKINYKDIRNLVFTIHSIRNFVYWPNMQDPRLLSAVLLSFGNELAAVSDKKSLIRLIGAQMRSHLTVSDILLSIINEDRQTHSVFVHHQDPALESGEEYV